MIEAAVIWLILAIAWTVRSWPSLLSWSLPDADDSTRLVQVRELLAGQSWWDLTLYRSGMEGLNMHWSRHVDALLAGLSGLVRPVVSQETAELVAVIFMPLALLAVALLLIAWIAQAISDRPHAGLYAMVVFALGTGAISRFEPGRIDHHGLQIVLALAMVAAVLRPDAPHRYGLAGLAGGASLTIGLEALPVVIGVVAGVALQWAFGALRSRLPFIWLGLGLVFSSLLFSIALAEPQRILGRECDVLSLGFFGLVALPSLGLALLGGSERPAVFRWAALFGMAIAGTAWFGVTSPGCVAGPYASIPQPAHDVWLTLIGETESWVSYLGSSPIQALGLLLGPVVALVWLSWRFRVSPGDSTLPLILALFSALVLTLWQIRAGPIALALSAPVLGALLGEMRARITVEMLKPVLMVAAGLILSGFPFFYGGSLDPSGRSAESGNGIVSSSECLNDQLILGLRAEPTGTVAIEMDLAPDVLVHTDHRTMAGPYHRGYADVIDMYDMYIADPVDAEQLARGAGVSVIVVCDGTGMSTSWGPVNEDGLLSRLLQDRPPLWLEKKVEAGRARAYILRG